MSQENTTESRSKYDNLEELSTQQLLEGINSEDQLVALAVQKEISSIEKLVDVVYEKMLNGGRLFYIGAGTSGRLGILDASEIPPTYGMPHDKVIGLMAGGDRAIRKAVEFAEDDEGQAWNDLSNYGLNEKDFLLGIAASGRTPYVIGGIREANKHNIQTGCIVCNTGSILAKLAKFPIEIVVGPEFVTGSTRMKSGTAQKMVLNMVSTSLMIKLGKVRGNQMIHMQLTNEKLIARGIKMIVEALNVSENEAKKLLQKFGNVNSVLSKY